MAKKIRYAVVGLGHIAQVAVLPAFRNARRNSTLTALVSDDETKLRELAEEYNVAHTFSDLDACLHSGEVDALYIASPNHQHCEFAVRAAEAGVHVLCEKPMATTTEECEKMIHAAEAADVRLMIAYRLHFEEANLKAVELAQSGALGELRFFSSVFAINAREGNIRLQADLGGGTLFDLGIYCINAARYLFRSEPVEVCALSASGRDPRFAEVDEMTGAVLKFPGDRLATMLASFGASDVGSYQIVGTQGDLRVDPAYDYAQALTHHLTQDGATKKKTFRKRDQFGPQLLYFSDCVLGGRTPEPDGREGLIDVAIIEALYESARTGTPVRLALPPKAARPTLDQEMSAPPVEDVDLVHAESPEA